MTDNFILSHAVGRLTSALGFTTLLLASVMLATLVLPTQAEEALSYRWKQIQGPNVIGHIEPVGVGMAGNGKWITSRAYLNGSRFDFGFGNGVEKQPDVS